MPDITVQDLIRREADAAGVDPVLALSVAEQESGFNPTARNKKSGAIGTFQFLPSTARDRGVNAEDPIENIRGGVNYLRDLADKHQGNVDKILAEYGGVRNDTTYVPGVKARFSKFAQAPQQAQPAATPPPGATPPAQAAATPPPAPGLLESAKASLGRFAEHPLESTLSFGQDVLKGFDPRTPTGRRNLAGGIGAFGATALAPELAVPIWAARALGVGVPLAGAYLGGAAEQGVVEPVIQGEAPDLQKVRDAGLEQLKNEAIGQGVGRFVAQPIARRVMGTRVAKGISQGLSDLIDAGKSALRIPAPAVSPAGVGQMVEQVAKGPATTVRQQLGEAVNEAARKGPRVDPTAINAKLDDVTQQLNPGAGNAPVPMPAGFTPQQWAATLAANPQAFASIPADHPLPGALNRARTIIQENTGADGKIPFEIVHQTKRLLDDAINYNSPARTQVQGTTRGLRNEVRSALSTSPEYDVATEEYSKVAKQFTKGNYPKLHKEIVENPEGVVARLDWDKPSSAKLLKDLTVDTASQAGPAGARGGQNAWRALQHSYTHENLVTLGPEKMLAEMRKMEASGNGREFIQTMYGDPAGQAVWGNLKAIGEGVEKAIAKEAEYSQTPLASRAGEGPLNTARDIALLAVPHHHVVAKGSALVRLIKGPDVKDMIQWAAYSPKNTQWLVKHVLTGPEPGEALADFLRWYKGQNASTVDTNTSSNAPQQAATPPPAPR